MLPYYHFAWIPPNQVFPKGVCLLLTASGKHLQGIYVRGQKNAPAIPPTWVEQKHHPFLQQVARKLYAYFSGQQKTIEVPYKLVGTPFQKKIWQQLSTIPYGHQISYKGLAHSFATQQPIRPVANAVANNPLLFLLPCHRVIGSDGKLRGFSAGLVTKARLHRLEKIRAGQPLFLHRSSVCLESL